MHRTNRAAHAGIPPAADVVPKWRRPGSRWKPGTVLLVFVAVVFGLVAEHTNSKPVRGSWFKHQTLHEKLQITTTNYSNSLIGAWASLLAMLCFTLGSISNLPMPFFIETHQIPLFLHLMNLYAFWCLDGKQGRTLAAAHPHRRETDQAKHVAT